MTMPRSTARSAWVLAACVVCTWASGTRAARVDPATEAARLVADLERAVLSPPRKPKQTGPDARSLLTRGKAELAGGRYANALDAFHQALELELLASSPAGLAPELEFLLGSVYLEAAQPYSAYRHLLVIANRSDEPGYAPFAARALARLVDAAFATENPDLLPGLRDLLDRLLGIERSDELSYARAKLAFALGRYREARELAGSIGTSGLTYK